MNLPYGMSNFAEIRRGRYYYADKTRFIPRLEDPTRGRRYLAFLRPRRFGKSTLLSMLEYYYGVEHAPRFDELFGGLAIAEQPTADRGRYAVLRLEFTGIDPERGIDVLRADFLGHLDSTLRSFIGRYRELMPKAAAMFEARLPTDSPPVLMHSFLTAMEHSPYPLYVLIDEYDNFANNIIAHGKDQVYYDIVQAGGFVQEFYKTLKAATTTGVVGRLLMTGVTPILLNDMTSGFNILAHISRDLDFHDLCGLSAAEVKGLLGQVLAERPFTLSREEVMEDLRRYYNGYLFHDKAEERVYNPDMVLYFLKGLRPPAGYPIELLDPNARTDYRRLDSLLLTPDRRARPHPIALICEVIADKRIVADLFTLFPLAEAYGQRFFASYLYYLGLLTIERREGSRLSLVIPNYVVERLHGDGFQHILEQQLDADILPDDVKTAVDAMAFQGEIEPLLHLLYDEVLSKLSNRDLIRMDEKSAKLMMLAFLSQSHVFFPFSELELGQGYSDLVLTLNRAFPDAAYSFLIELKYVKVGDENKAEKAVRKGASKAARGGKVIRGALSRRVEEAMLEGEEQLARYLGDPRLAAVQGPKGWKAVTVVFVGTRAVYYRERGQKTRAISSRA